jgi:hypothetical protein
MEALRIEILNPKVRDILDRLADLHLITISKESDSASDLKELLQQLRSKSTKVPTSNDIQEEVQQVRTDRYAKKHLQGNS